MKRREFLKASIPAAALMHGGWSSLLLHAKENTRENAPLDAYDVVVIGGTLIGCFAAMHAARKGLRVLLIERRTFLATDITATLRPWLNRKGFETFGEEMRELFMPQAEQPEVGVPFEPQNPDNGFGSDVPLFCGSVKKQFMATLQKEGVHVLLMTGVWGVLADEQKRTVSGLALANKFGLQLVRCKSVVDTTSHDSANRGIYSFSLELYGVADSSTRKASVPASLGLLDDNVCVHRGKRRPGQSFVEFRFAATPEEAEREARVKTESLCAYLIEHDAAFGKARLAQIAWEAVKQEKQSGHASYRNYVSPGNADTRELSCQDVLEIDQRAQSLVQGLSIEANVGDQAQFIHHDSGRIPLEQCEVTGIDDIRLNYAIQGLALDYEKHLPVGSRTDVIVAGGGTAGAMAAIGAIEQKANVITVEYFPELGGTKTLGGVMGYYWGYKDTALFDRIDQAVKEQGKALGAAASRLAMMFYLRKQATQDGGKLLTNSTVCGVTKDRNRVTGILVERDGALTILNGKVIVDATGDGDVAVFAGAAWEAGDQRMKATQNYSQWDINPGGKAWADSSTNRDYDILMNQYLSELQRGYRVSHGQSHHYDFMPMLTVRESRRVVGEYTITLKDVVEGRHHADTICLAYSDYDPHHFGDTALTRVGCLLPHGISAVVQIPYRALLPKGIRGLLVSAKAISQTHNALQFTRMSFDIMTQGYVTGWIAGLATREGTDLRDFNVDAIRPALVELRILRASRVEERVGIGQRIDQLVAGEPDSLIRMLALPGEEVEPVLLERLRQSKDEGESLRLAKALAWFGNPIGNPLILREMETLYAAEQAGGTLPWEYYRKDKETDYWTINQDIALLAMSGDGAMLPAILALADSLKLNNPPVRQETTYNRGRIDLALVPYYNRLVNICFAIGLMPDRRASGTLKRFLNDPYIRGHITETPEQAGDRVYGGILESRIAATLARCGEKRGFDVLVKYIDDVHYLLAHYARQQLSAILEQDCGYNRQEWAKHIAGLTFPRPPRPRRADSIEW